MELTARLLEVRVAVSRSAERTRRLSVAMCAVRTFSRGYTPARVARLTRGETGRAARADPTSARKRRPGSDGPAARITWAAGPNPGGTAALPELPGIVAVWDAALYRGVPQPCSGTSGGCRWGARLRRVSTRLSPKALRRLSRSCGIPPAAPGTPHVVCCAPRPG